MTSAIDPIYPTEVEATTQSVRDNFAAAKAEIEALQIRAFKTKTIKITRDNTAAAGNQVVTGLGFRPRKVESRWIVGAAMQSGWAEADASTIIGNSFTDKWYDNPLLCDAYVTGGRVWIDSHVFDADGATFHWSKTSAPTGTTFLYLTFTE